MPKEEDMKLTEENGTAAPGTGAKTHIIPAPAASTPVPSSTPDTMMALIEKAVASGHMDALDKLLAMKRELDHDAARRAYDHAIAAAKAEIGPIIKRSQVDFTSSKGRTHYSYETMADIARIVDPPLAKYGLSYRYRTSQDERGVSVTCIIAHRDGHSEETTLSGPPDQSGNKNAFQAVGSTVTYLQRYTLRAALGLAAAKDDDARGASEEAPSVISEEQYMQLKTDIEMAGLDEEVVCEAEGIEMLPELPQKRYEEVRRRLAQNIKRRREREAAKAKGEAE